MFKTNIIQIGKAADYFRSQGLLVLFSDETDGISPDYCYKINRKPIAGEIEEGMVLYLDQQPYTITAVGSDVKDNLDKYGHITMRFDGSRSAELPGTLYLEKKSLPLIDTGMEVKIA